MSQKSVPEFGIRDRFALSPSQLHLAVSAVAATIAGVDSAIAANMSQATMPGAPALHLPKHREFTPPSDFSPTPDSLPQRFVNLLHHYSLGVFALLFLLVATAGIEVGGRYWSARVLDSVKPALAAKAVAPTISGLNLTVPAKDLQSKLQTIANQPATLTVGSQSIPVGSDTIRNWLQVTTSADKSQDYIRIKAGTIAASLNQLANQFVKAPANQITINEAGVNQVVAVGSNGTALTDPAGLKTQANAVAKTVMNGGGMQFTTPLQTVPFQAVTPCNFNKSLDVNVSTKQMYAYQGCDLVNTFAVSAGAPDTPTPLGVFQIWEKLTSQTMKGTYPVPYVQPNVPYINYFDHSGDAVHGNYWRPASVFGQTNTSHGCVSVPVDQAEWIYNWAPIGTTVVTHA
jgi:lipoprotein-anchoring transpeptidase ErfK/SrfK